jgi:WD40 repeat protein
MMKKTFAPLALLAAIAVIPACGNLDGPRPVDTIAYLPDGALVAFMSTGIHVFDTSLDVETSTILFDGLPVDGPLEWNRYSLSADGRVAAVSFPASFSRAPSAPPEPSTIALFDMTTGRRLTTIRPDDAAPFGRSQGVTDLAISPHADLVYSRSPDWTGVDPNDATQVADVPYRATVFDAATGTALWTREGDVKAPVFSADGNLLFVEANDPPRVEALDAHTGAVVYTIALPGYVYTLTLTGDGKLAGLVGPPVDESCPNPGECPPSYEFWSPADGALLATSAEAPGTDTHATNPHGAAAFWCSPWDNLCATDIIDFTMLPQQGPPALKIWRTDGSVVRTIAAYADAAVNVATFSPDGRFIATATFVGTSQAVRVFRINDGALLGTLDFHWDFL